MRRNTWKNAGVTMRPMTVAGSPRPVMVNPLGKASESANET
jgi:hypothetical protein